MVHSEVGCPVGKSGLLVLGILLKLAEVGVELGDEGDVGGVGEHGLFVQQGQDTGRRFL